MYSFSVGIGDRTTEWQVALLRGVNVGPAKRISMAVLRALVEGLGYGEPRTLLNSGNVVFRASGHNAATIASRIEEALAADIGLSCRVVVISARELATIIEANPLLHVASNPSRLLVALPGNPGGCAALAALVTQDWGEEKLAVTSAAAYLWVPDGVIKSVLNKAVNKAMKDNVTSRNWATMLKLWEAVR
jgi:uncharacterized protein (DUF1697 family)